MSNQIVIDVQDDTPTHILKQIVSELKENIRNKNRKLWVSRVYLHKA